MLKSAHLPPLFLGTNDGIGINYQMFLKQLAGKLAENDQERYEVVIAWLRTGTSFEILRAVHVSVRRAHHQHKIDFYRRQ